jgi:hypothetical protein
MEAPVRDWKSLPYWGTEVSIDKSLQEIHRELDRYGVDAVRVTQRRNPWGIVVEWEITVTEKSIPVLVTFDIQVDDAELEGYTASQQRKIPLQAARLLFYTIKNLLAAVECGLLTPEEAFLARFQTWAAGKPVPVGDLVLEQIRQQGSLGPTIGRLALPAGSAQ